MQNLNNNNKISLAAIFIFTIFLAIISGFAFLIEIKPFLASNTSPTARFNILEKNNVTASLSLSANRLKLNNCLEALAGPIGMAQPTSRRKNVLTSCQKLARNITKSMPTHAFAYYIGAFASAELRQYETFNFQVVASQKTAPNEQWLAELRVDLVEDKREYINTQTNLSQNKDLTLLAKSAKGVKSIANRYVKQPKFRERITSLVETLSPNEQREFIRNVKTAAREISIERGGLQ